MTTAEAIHPGEHLVEFMEELGVTQYRLAKAIGTPQMRIHDIVHGRRSITADTALRIGQALGMTPDFWLNLQRMYDLDVARAKTDVSAIEPLVEAPVQSMIAASRPEYARRAGRPAEGEPVIHPERQAIRDELIRVAKRRGLVTYSELGAPFGLSMKAPPNRKRIGESLDAISQDEHRAGRPLLSAVVIRKELNRSGAGFFKIAKRLGLRVTSDDALYWKQELGRVYDYWSSDRSR